MENPRQFSIIPDSPPSTTPALKSRCITVSAAKYICKYAYKGPTRSDVGIKNGEIAAYLDGRYLSSHGAFWLLLHLDIHGRPPEATRLHAHLEDEQSAVIRGAELTRDLAARPGKAKNLTEWFVANAEYPNIARCVKRRDSPHRIKWGTKASKWKPRKRPRGNFTGRMYSGSPLEGARFYRRLLLTAGSGCTSYECLRKAPDCDKCATSRESASSCGLLLGENEYYLVFPDASSSATPWAMSRLFAPILAYRYPGAPREMGDSPYPHIEEAGAVGSFPKTAIRPHEDIRAAGSSRASFPTLPQIAQLQSRILTSDGKPEFETSPQRQLAETISPKPNAEP